MRLQSPNRIAAGFTLVEVIIVMAIISIVMLAVMSFFVPVSRSTITQTKVADVHANLRLAMDRMTKDLLMAGFLIENPDTTPAIINTSSTGFTIQTRMVGHGFARISAEQPAGTAVLPITNSQMAAAFVGDTLASKASKVRIYDPLTAREVDTYASDSSPTASNDSYLRLYNVKVASGTQIELSNPVPVAIPEEAIIVLVVPAGNPNPGPPPLQTIRYQLDAANDALLRIVNGNQQILARGVAGVNFAFQEVDGRIRRVDIELTGQTKALNAAQQNDLLSGAKTRSLRSSVTLRNV